MAHTLCSRALFVWLAGAGLNVIVGVINLASAREIDPFCVTITVVRASGELGSTGGVLDRSAFELLGCGVFLDGIRDELLDLPFVKSLVGGCLV